MKLSSYIYNITLTYLIDIFSVNSFNVQVYIICTVSTLLEATILSYGYSSLSNICVKLIIKFNCKIKA